MRNLVALAALALAGASICQPEPALAAGGARGAFPAFRAPLILHRSPRAPLGHRPFARPHTFGHPHAHRIVTRPFGTVKPMTPFGTVAASTAFGTVAPLIRSQLVRRHHRAYHAGWSFPVTIGGDASYIGTPYDPAEVVPVYGPEPAVIEVDPTPAPAVPARRSVARDENADACRSERVTVPARDGEREITVVRC